MSEENCCKPCKCRKTGLLLALVVALALLGIYRGMEDNKDASSLAGNATNSTNSTGSTGIAPADSAPVAANASANAAGNTSAGQAASAVPATTITLDAQALKDSKPIDFTLLSSRVAEVDGQNITRFLLVPAVDWQGDFTKERIAATLLKVFNETKANNNMLDIIFLPVGIKHEQMLAQSALGRFIYTPEQPFNQMFVVKRGYLPLEVDYIVLRDQMLDSFTKDGLVNEKDLNDAIIETLGPSAMGMEYPFQPLLKVVEPAFVN